MPPRTMRRLWVLSAGLLLTAPLGLGIALHPPTAMAQGPAQAPAQAQTKRQPLAAPQSSEADTRTYIGTWALGDSNNNLFNVRIDYSDGWSDWIYVGPEGLSHAAWQPGQSRGSVPFNFGPAVKLTGPLAQIVGVYSFPPAQAELRPYTATLLSNGQAFNDIDARTGGVWTLEGNTVVIDWISGWRTTMSINPATPLQLRHWAPGADRKGPETGGTRQGKRVE